MANSKIYNRRNLFSNFYSSAVVTQSGTAHNVRPIHNIRRHATRF